MEAMRARTRLLAVVLLVGATAAWGSTFVVMKEAVAHVPVPEFLGWRFLLAGSLLVALRPGALRRLGARGWAHAVVLGSVLAGGYLVQTYGLRDTPPAVSGFLTGLQVLFTPFLAWLLAHRGPGRRTWAATAVATAGLALITSRGVSLGAGEILTVASAALFAAQIVGVGRWVSSRDAYGLAAAQLLVVAAICLAVQAPEGVSPPASVGQWRAVVLTAVAATSFAFMVQSWAQSHIPATTTSVVFTLEPVFAALFAGLTGEPLGWPVVVGGGLVVASMLVLGAGRSGPSPGRGEPAGPRGVVRAVEGEADERVLAAAGASPG